METKTITFICDALSIIFIPVGIFFAFWFGIWGLFYGIPSLISSYEYEHHKKMIERCKEFPSLRDGCKDILEKYGESE